MGNNFKPILYLAVFLLLLLGTLWILGGNTRESSAEIEIDAPIDKIYFCIKDPKYMMDWMNGLIEVEPIDENSFNLLIDENGKQVSKRHQLIKEGRPQLISMSNTTQALKTTMIFRLAQTQFTTKVTYKVREIHQGVSRLFAFFKSGPSESSVQEELRAIKSVVEKNIDDIVVPPEEAKPADPETEENEPVNRFESPSSSNK